MSSFFTNNSAATLLQGSQSSLNLTQDISQTAFTQSADLDDQSASLVEQSTALQAQNAALEGKAFREQQAQGYNNSGVELEGSPMKVLEQTRQLAQTQVASIISQGQQQSNALLIGANQTLNNGYAGLLGQTNDYITSVAQAKIQAEQNTESGFAGDLTQIFGILGSGGKNSILAGLFNN